MNTIIKFFLIILIFSTVSCGQYQSKLWIGDKKKPNKNKQPREMENPDVNQF